MEGSRQQQHLASRCFLATCFLLCSSFAVTGAHFSHRDTGKQSWGYIETRPGANMFWWLYYVRASDDYTKHPLVMWLQGGPGASSTGVGNFLEIGPQDVKLQNRTATWVNYTNVLFVDNPVGTGFSYVNDTKLLATNNTMVVNDLITMLKVFLMQKLPEFQTVPFYIFAESYGGKMAAQLAAALSKQIIKGKIKCALKGVALGDSWISPVDSILTWGPFLYSTSLVDTEGLSSINGSAFRVKAAVEEGKFQDATKLWEETESVVENTTNGVDFYNILGRSSSSVKLNSKDDFMDRLYHRHVKAMETDELSQLMNGPIKKMLRVIPKNVTWGGQSTEVFKALSGDFMKPVVGIVELLLNTTPISVSVYNGQLDLIVDTLGTTSWVNSLRWAGAQAWTKASRKPVMIGDYTVAFKKNYKNFNFFWVLRAGHMVPKDACQTGLKLLQSICGLDG